MCIFIKSRLVDESMKLGLVDEGMCVESARKAVSLGIWFVLASQ